MALFADRRESLWAGLAGFAKVPAAYCRAFLWPGERVTGPAEQT
jgi:hypothetical protein